MKKIYLGLLLAIFALHGCSLFTGHVMRKDQGNIIEPKDMEKLKVGLSQDKVRALFGPPLAQPLGQTNPWEYVFTSNAAKVYQSRIHHLRVYFDAKGQVSRWEYGTEPNIKLRD